MEIKLKLPNANSLKNESAQTNLFKRKFLSASTETKIRKRTFQYEVLKRRIPSENYQAKTILHDAAFPNRWLRIPRPTIRGPNVGLRVDPKQK